MDRKRKHTSLEPTHIQLKESRKFFKVVSDVVTRPLKRFKGSGVFKIVRTVKEKVAVVLKYKEEDTSHLMEDVIEEYICVVHETKDICEVYDCDGIKERHNIEDSSYII